MTALITGGAGFIGSNLVRFLVGSGERVRVLDNLSTGSIDNLIGFSNAVELMVADVRNHTAVREAVADADVVYHLAALPSVSRSVADPVTSNSVNVEGTLTVLSAARDAEVRRVVYASSSSLYGDTPTLPKHEEMPVAPLSPYAISKFAGEAYCGAFSRCYGLETVSLRFFNVFGPHQDPSSQYSAVIPRFISRMLSGASPRIFGDGRQSRDFTFVGNAVRACKLAAEAGPDAVGEAMNVGGGERTTLLMLVEMLGDLLDVVPEAIHDPPRTGDVAHSLADISKAERLVGYRPEVSFERGLAATTQWFVDRKLTVS